MANCDELGWKDGADLIGPELEQRLRVPSPVDKLDLDSICAVNLYDRGKVAPLETMLG